MVILDLKPDIAPPGVTTDVEFSDAVDGTIDADCERSVPQSPAKSTVDGTKSTVNPPWTYMGRVKPVMAAIPVAPWSVLR
jgi:hypothetical protein